MAAVTVVNQNSDDTFRYGAYYARIGIRISSEPDFLGSAMKINIPSCGISSMS